MPVGGAGCTDVCPGFCELRLQWDVLILATRWTMLAPDAFDCRMPLVITLVHLQRGGGASLMAKM